MMSNTSCINRFNCQPRMNYYKLAVNLIPFPRLKFFQIGISRPWAQYRQKRDKKLLPKIDDIYSMLLNSEYLSMSIGD